MSKPAIQIIGLRKSYGKVVAVDGLDLEIETGEIFGLLGPNGAGKTTTIATILGVSRPTGGSVTVFGLDSVRSARKIRAMTGYVMQQIALDRYLTGRENCRLHGELFGLTGANRDQRVEEVLAWADLLDAAGRVVNTYSGGMMRRLDLAISMLHQPRLIVLDEPTLGLDIETRRKLWALIGRMKAQGVTILITTHYLEEASRLCDRVGIMHKGKLVGLGPPEDLKRDVVGELHQLQVTLSGSIALDGLNLPVRPERENGHLVFNAAPERLWETLGILQHTLPEAIQTVSYDQPTLDDVFLKLTNSEVSA